MSLKSFRPDVFDVDRCVLIGASCPDCTTRSFPIRDSCPECGSAREPDTFVLSGHGQVCSYTIVHQAPGGLKTPYVLAYVDLPEDTVRVMARIDTSDPHSVRIGMPVELVTLPLHETLEEAPSDAASVAMFAFRPNEGATR